MPVWRKQMKNEDWVCILANCGCSACLFFCFGYFWGFSFFFFFLFSFAPARIRQCKAIRSVRYPCLSTWTIEVSSQLVWGFHFCTSDKAGSVVVETNVREMQVMLPQLKAGIRPIFPISGHRMRRIDGSFRR